MKYRKKPVVIEAVQFLGIDGGKLLFSEDQPDWLKAGFANELIRVHPIFPDTRLQVETLEGNMIADKEDWIICGVKQELYPCKPDVFEESYEEVDEA